MSAKETALTLSLDPADNERLALLCGQFDNHLKTIEHYFGVEITNRGAEFSISGEHEPAKCAGRSLRDLYAETATDPDINEATVQRVLDRAARDGEQRIDLRIRTPKKQVKPHNPRQAKYLQHILTHDINFGVGPAGTGKTFLAVACAAQALAENEVNRIVLVRPAVEAGERLGFLPGDIGQKVDPYLRPLYDALYELLGFEKVSRLMDRNIIELAPLAYMRGRTLSDSFVILDEAQNSTVKQMKMFLTRIGFGSKAVVTGDITQTDLPRGTSSGLSHAIEILSSEKDISVTRFHSADVVRHRLVQRIIEAYETHERDQQGRSC